MLVELYGVFLGNIGFPPNFTHLINIPYFMQGLVMGTGLMQQQDVASFSSKTSFFLQEIQQSYAVEQVGIILSWI